MKRKIGFIATLVMMLCLMVCMGMSVSAAEVVETGECGAQGDNVTYTLYDDGELIISGEGDMQNYDSKTAYFQNLDVKSVIINSGVTSIGEYAFYNSDTIMSITISESVTDICERAFYDCINLINITLPNEVTNIGVCAFYGCDSILNITIPSGVTNIGVWAFSNCLSLENIVVDSDNDYYSSIDGVLLDKNNSKLIQYPIGNTRTSYTIPDNVKTIGVSAFEYGDNLISITIPDGVTTIGSYAFKYCTELISVSMPDSITRLADRAFEDCRSLKNVVIPSGVKTIYGQTFMYCYSLENVVIPDGVTSIGEKAFAYCDSLTDITIPHSVTSIGKGAFSCSSNLTNIIVDDANDSYSSVDGVLFNEDKTEIICCPSGNTRISYSIPESVNVIGYQAFNECETLTDVTIPSSVTSICDGAFHLCNGLTSITIPDSVTSIGKSVFSNCENLISVTLSENITSISDNLFYVCRNLTSITIPDGVKSIGKDAFASCRKLTDITIPDSIEDIGSRAFYFCSFKSITIPEGVKSIGDNAFYGSDLTTVTIPNGITCINEGTFEACDKLASITIPENVTSIGTKAFDRCNKLSDVYYVGNSEQWSAIAIENNNEPLTGAAIHYAVETGSCGDKGDNVTYILYDDGKLVISGTGKMYDYDNFSDFSPFYKSDIKTAVVEVGVTSIGDGMFERCDSLEEVVIPDGVTYIGDSAFYSCSSLPNVTIPYGVTIIGDNTFSGCSKFTSITIPDSVTSIGISAFSCCYNITSITIPDSVITLGRGAFDRCSAATSITIGKSVRSIGISTFNDCDKIESIYIPASVTSIESSAFSDWHSLKEIIVDENNENYISEQGILFNKDRTQLVKYPSSKEGTVYTVPESVESFGTYEAFGDCKHLEEIVIGSKVTALGNFMFQDCENLKKVELSDELTTIDLGSFWGCSNLKDITIPDSVTIIEQDAFRDCSSLTLIEIPKNVASIDKEAFSLCTALENIIVDEQNNYYTSENGVLYNKDKSVLVQYPAGKKDSTYTLNLNTSVIEKYALSYNTYLEKIVLYQELTEIMEGAFFGCKKLSDVYYYGTQEEWNNILIGTSNDILLGAYIHFNIDSCKHTEDGYEAVVTKENIIKATYSESGSYDEVAVCKNCEREIDRVFKEIPALWLSNISFSFDNGVLAVWGTGEIPGGLAEYPWTQYADGAEIIRINNISSIGKNVFTDFYNVVMLEINGQSVKIDDRAFTGCDSLSTVIAFTDIEASNSVFDVDTEIFLERSKRNLGSCKAITFDYLDKKLTFYGDVSLSGEEFLNIIAVMCGNYDEDIEIVAFNGTFSTVGFSFWRWTNKSEFEGKYETQIVNAEFKAAVSLNLEEYETISFDTMYEKILSGKESNFYLVIEDEEGNDYQEEEVSILKNIYQRVLKAFKALIDWLVKLFK